MSENLKDLPVLLTTKQAASILQMKTQSLRTWACYGTGPVEPVRISRGGPLRWRRDDLIKLVEGEISAI